MSDNFLSIIIRYRFLTLAFISFVTIALFHQMNNLVMDNSNESALIHDDETQRKFDEFKKVFGNDDFIYILLNTGDIYDAKILKRVNHLVEILQKDVPFIKQLTWLGTAEQIKSDSLGVTIQPVMAPLPASEKDLQDLKQRIEEYPDIVGQLISSNHDVLALFLEFYPYPDVGEDGVDPRQRLAPALNKVLAEYSDLEPHAVGGPIISYTFDQLGAEEMNRLGLISLIVMFFVLIFTTRRVSGVVIPMVVIILSLIWTMGIIALVSIPLSTLVIMLPILLVCVCIGDSMHFVADCLNKIRQGRQRDIAIRETFSHVAWPIVLTSLTTIAGFLSFLTISIQPIQEIGLQAVVGVLVALFLSLTLSPILMSFTPNKNRAKDVAKNLKSKESDFFTRFLTGVADFAFAYKKIIVTIFAAVSVISLIGYTWVKPETNSIRDLEKTHPLHIAYDLIDDSMGGSMALEIVVDSGYAGGVKQPDFLVEIEKMQGFVDSLALTKKSFSILDALKKMRSALNNNDPSFYALPRAESEVAEYLFLYETGGGAEIDKFVSFDYRLARLQVRTQSLSSKDVHWFIEQVDQYIANELNPKYTSYTTGTMAWMATLADHIVVGQLMSFAFAFIAIGIMLFFVFRNIKMTIIAMLPNILPALVCLGIMGFSNIYMHMMLMILAPIIISVSVDDTIHFFFHFRREFQKNPDYKNAIYATIAGVGRPLLFTTLVLSAGFCVFSFSVMDTLNDFGFLAATSFLVALITDFLLVSALLHMLKPLQREANAVQEIDANLVLEK